MLAFVAMRSMRYCDMLSASDSPCTKASPIVRGWRRRRPPGLAELPAPIMYTSFPFARLASLRRTVVHPGADEPIDGIDLQAPPLHACRENDRPRPDDVASVQRHGHLSGIDALDPPRHDDLGAQCASPVAGHGSRGRRRTRRKETRCSSRSGSRYRPARQGRTTRSVPSSGPRKRC